MHATPESVGPVRSRRDLAGDEESLNSRFSKFIDPDSTIKSVREGRNFYLLVQCAGGKANLPFLFEVSNAIPRDFSKTKEHSSMLCSSPFENLLLDGYVYVLGVVASSKRKVGRFSIKTLLYGRCSGNVVLHKPLIQAVANLWMQRPDRACQHYSIER